MMSKICTKGYHGTIQENANKILSEKRFHESNRENDWLGRGVYFFAYLYHAKWWITHSRFQGKETSILQAALEYDKEQLLDLDDPENIAVMEELVKNAVEKGANTSNSVSADVLSVEKSKRWCFACNLYKHLFPEVGIIKYTFSPNKNRTKQYSGFGENQQQMCVSRPEIIRSIEEYTDGVGEKNG